MTAQTLGPTTHVAVTEHDHPAARADRGRRDGVDRLFDSVYPAAVGVARRVLDRDGRALPSSRPAAERIAQDAFARAAATSRLQDDTSGVARVMSHVADACLERLVGHPGTVPLHPELLGPDIEFDGELPLAELQEALCDLRRRDRRVGLLALAAGLRPVEVAALLGLALDDTLHCLARVGTRLADGRRVGTDHPVELRSP